MERAWVRDRDALGQPQASRRFRGGRRFAFAESETIHTETCRKFDVAGFAQAAQRSGWRVDRIWSDPAELFAVFGVYAEARALL